MDGDHDIPETGIYVSVCWNILLRMPLLAEKYELKKLLAVNIVSKGPGFPGW